MLLTLALLVLAALVGGVAGVLVAHRLDHARAVVAWNAMQAAQRANNASAQVEAANLPDVLERVEDLNTIVRRFIAEAQRAERKADENAKRQTELEQAIASAFSITLTGRR
jgi:hypothetical protein